MITDSLTFLGQSFNGPSADASTLLALMDDLHVDRAIVCPFKPASYDLRRANDAVAEAVRKHSGRLVGMCRVDPWQGDAAVAEIDRCMGPLGLAGIFLNPWEESFNVAGSQSDPIAEAAAQHHVPVIVAAGYPFVSEGLQVGALASRHPTVSFIATNGCQLNISGLATYDADFALARNPNLAIQTAGVYRQDFLNEMVEKHGADRLMFASAFPLTDPRLEILRVSRGGFDEAERRAIYRETAQHRIFDWTR